MSEVGWKVRKASVCVVHTLAFLALGQTRQSVKIKMNLTSIPDLE